MSTIDHVPLGDWKVPAPSPSVTYAATAQRLGICSGLFALTEGGGRTSVTHGSSSRRGRHLIMVFDLIDGAGFSNNGVFLELWTLGDSDLTANAFHASGKKLQEDLGGSALSTSNHGIPDGVVAANTLFHLDGHANWPHPGLIDPAYVFIDQSGFTDETGAATDDDEDDVTIANVAAGDVMYFGSAATFRHVLFRIDTASTVGVATIVYEYWNGSSWTALTVTDGLTPSAGNPFVNVLQYVAAWFSSVPGDWVATTVNGQSAFWVRIRWSAVTATYTPTFSRCWIFEVTATEYLAPASYHISGDPANVTPEVIPWGIDCWWSPIGFRRQVATFGKFTPGLLKVRACYYDSARDIESPLGPELDGITVPL